MSNSGSSIISSLSSSLTNTYSYLAALNPNGVTLESITKAKSDNSNYLTLNQTFASYLQSNFSSIDKNGDGIISADEMNNVTNQISSYGVTKTQLSQLAASGTYSSDTISKIMDNFDDIDTNNDGRVTSEEIASYTVSANKQEKVDEENYKKATNMSLFYGDDSSSDELSSYSILSYKYKDFNSK